MTKLGKTDGFLGNDKVKIPLPDSLQQVDGLLRKFGMGKYADEFGVTMNRAADPVGQASKLLSNVFGAI